MEYTLFNSGTYSIHLALPYATDSIGIVRKSIFIILGYQNNLPEKRQRKAGPMLTASQLSATCIHLLVFIVSAPTKEIGINGANMKTFLQKMTK